MPSSDHHNAPSPSAVVKLALTMARLQTVNAVSAARRARVLAATRRLQAVGGDSPALQHVLNRAKAKAGNGELLTAKWRAGLTSRKIASAHSSMAEALGKRIARREAVKDVLKSVAMMSAGGAAANMVGAPEGARTQAGVAGAVRGVGAGLGLGLMKKKTHQAAAMAVGAGTGSFLGGRLGVRVQQKVDKHMAKSTTKTAGDYTEHLRMSAKARKRTALRRAATMGHASKYDRGAKKCASEMNPHVSHGLELAGLGILAAPTVYKRVKGHEVSDKVHDAAELAGLGVLGVGAVHHLGGAAVRSKLLKRVLQKAASADDRRQSQGLFKADIAHRLGRIVDRAKEITRLTDDDKLGLSAMEMKRQESGGKAFVRMSKPEMDAYKTKAQSSGFHDRYWSRLDDKQNKPRTAQMASEVRDPRLYSNLRGMAAGESRAERVRAHAHLKTNASGGVTEAMRHGFGRKTAAAQGDDADQQKDALLMTLVRRMAKGRGQMVAGDVDARTGTGAEAMSRLARAERGGAVKAAADKTALEPSTIGSALGKRLMREHAGTALAAAKPTAQLATFTRVGNPDLARRYAKSMVRSGADTRSIAKSMAGAMRPQ